MLTETGSNSHFLNPATELFVLNRSVRMEGVVHFNGEKLTKRIKKRVGYVLQGMSFGHSHQACLQNHRVCTPRSSSACAYVTNLAVNILPSQCAVDTCSTHLLLNTDVVSILWASPLGWIKPPSTSHLKLTWILWCRRSPV